MDEVLKRYFESGPPEMTRKQLEDTCASQAMSFLHAFEQHVLVDRHDAGYGLPKIAEDA